MNVLVLGGARGVFEEVERALNLGEFNGVVTCNDVTAEWRGPILAAVTLHGDKWPFWLARRRGNNLPPPARVYAHLAVTKSKFKGNSHVTHYAEHLWPGQKDSGSSGLFAVKVALDELGATRVVCCGIPMEAIPHYFNARPWGGAPSHRKGWRQALPHLQGRVKSMSGWTAELLGKPTEAWLAEFDAKVDA